MIRGINALFPVWALAITALAIAAPEVFTARIALEENNLADVLSVLRLVDETGGTVVLGMPALIGPLLMIIMFTMGLTLRPRDFIAVFRKPSRLFIGMGLQFLIMPLAAWTIAHLLGLTPELTAGLVVLGASAGGTASNVIAFMAGGNLPLSIAMTAGSTLASVVATPLLTALYVGQSLDVPVLAMIGSIARMVIFPVLAGLVINHWLDRWLAARHQGLACIAMACILTVIAIIVALNRGQLAMLGPLLAIAVISHNLIGLGAGYWGAKWLGCDERDARTIAIEVGMQNSGLAAVLSSNYFGAAAALPGAIFSIWHNLSGSFLAGRWARSGSAVQPAPPR
ncbi:MAG: bile acid:sodium symporter [Porticoccaceae bacterium]|nr:bile acid:sodium symporter [Porticoccaceae bacterium]